MNRLIRHHKRFILNPFGKLRSQIRFACSTALKWEPQQSLAAKYEKDQCVSGKIRMEKLPTLSKEWKRIPPTDHLNIQGRSTHIQNQKILQSEI
jgi:hypothetical protein